MIDKKAPQDVEYNGRLGLDRRVTLDFSLLES